MKFTSSPYLVSSLFPSAQAGINLYISCVLCRNVYTILKTENVFEYLKLCETINSVSD